MSHADALRNLAKSVRKNAEACAATENWDGFEGTVAAMLLDLFQTTREYGQSEVLKDVKKLVPMPGGTLNATK